MKSNLFKILVVDDDPLNLEILEEILSERYLVRIAETGEDAIGLLPEFNPDLMLLDIMMPGIDGYEVCRRIRADYRYHLLKIILVSGKSMLEERLQGYDAGADDYIVKPFVDEELEAKIQVFLRLKRSEEVDQIKSDLLRVFSHETRTPLNGILLSTELLRSDESMSDEARAYIQVIEESGRRLLEFVKKTTLLCDIKSGLQLEKSNHSLNAYLKSSVNNVQKDANAKNIQIQLNVNTETVINADWRLLAKVFIYLIENAIKFSPAGATVTIEVIQVDATCEVRITDQGKGIEPEWMDKIFNEFAVRDVMHHQKGLGLSLAISRYLIEMHDGTIHAESDPSSKTTFIIRLPMK
ncbi:MAG: Response receiver sensor histidine kinase [Candidatus Magnetoglobus multicellularis str. Araruama]|uniref:histidine kinase n=1 Tax=Candidatus Magnetoglobus multicellularis str. Araruama TaxID=890399 RepID=A0A1V1PBS9_9BACT|nr:MAG: Response receiver sensor histidine kinase [Candidatus Magnetoglobus multicellularis str. Araruama]